MINSGAKRIVLRCISVVSTLLKKLIADTDVQFSESLMFKHACGGGLGVFRPRSSTAGISPAAATIGRERYAPPAPDAANLRFCAEGKFDGIYLGSPSITT